MRRRQFINTASAAAVTSCAGSIGLGQQASGQEAGQKKPQTTGPNPIGTSTYSFWHFKKEENRSIEHCIELAAKMGFDGVEILEVQMTDDSNAYFQKLKQQAFVNGLDLMGFSTHQGFVSPDAVKRQVNIEKTIRSIEKAYKLGIPTMRINTGRWGTTKSFDDLIFASAGKGGGGQASVIVRANANDGKVEVPWELNKGLPYVPTPVAYKGLLFVLADSGTMTCVNAESGEQKWKERVTGEAYCSPICIDGKIYCFSRRGEMKVVAAKDTYEVLGEHDFESDVHATPAVAGGRFYVRTESKLISIGKDPDPEEPTSGE